MEYVFGTTETAETLQVRGGSGDVLTGFHEVIRRYPDQVITDNFRIVKHFFRSIGEDGTVFDWYEIDKHSRDTDKFSPNKADIETGIADAQDATCELSEELDERISELEDAFCELTMEG